MDAQQLAVARRPDVADECGKEPEADYNEQVIKRQDAERSSDPERAERDPAIPGLLAQQERGNQVTAQNEEKLHAVPAIQGEGTAGRSAYQLDEHQPRYTAVVEVHHHERDEPEAVELWEIDPIDRLVGDGMLM